MKSAVIMIAGVLASPALAQVEERFPVAEIILQRDSASFSRSRTAFTLPSLDQLQNVVIDSKLRALVQQLEDPSFAVREEATRELIDSSPDRMQLYALLQTEPDLTPEQRYRLLTALRESLLRTPRGAIGISMQQVMPNFGMANAAQPIEIRVTDLIPGLPAERILQVGDRITHVDGQPLMRYDDLQFRVQCKKPGDTVALIVKRAKIDDRARPDAEFHDAEHIETLQLELELGSAELLRDFNTAQAQLNQFNQFNQFQQMQLAQRSPVEEMRMDEAKAAADRLAPRPRQIALGGNPRIANDQSTEAPLRDPDVENHPSIRTLRWQREEIDKGGLSAEELKLINDHLQQQLLDLYHQARSRSLTSDQREYLRAVIERFLELLQP